MKEKREVYDYYCHDRFLFRLGHVHYLEARTPLSPHTHDGLTEFVYIESGSQCYCASGRDYPVRQGEVFFTLPGELHYTSGISEEISRFYYFIIDLPLALSFIRSPAETENVSLQSFFQEKGSRVFSSSPVLPDRLKALLKCIRTKDFYYHTHIRNALSETLLALAAPSLKERETLPLTRSLHFIEEHIGERICVSRLAQTENMSLSAFHRHFQQSTGFPPAEYVLRRKVEKSKELLCNGKDSITAIAYQCGFSSSQYYATVFKRFCYVTPTEYRNAVK